MQGPNEMKGTNGWFDWVRRKQPMDVKEGVFAAVGFCGNGIIEDGREDFRPVYGSMICSRMA